MKYAWLSVITFLMVNLLSRADEVRKLKVVERNVPGLPGGVMEGEFKISSLLMLKVEERGEVFDDPSVISFRVFDPSAPGEGLREIFKGPGNDQSAWSVSPVFGKYAVFAGKLDRTKEPEGERKFFWWDLSNGEVGKEIDIGLSMPRTRGEWLEGTRTFSHERIVRYHAAKGIYQTLALDFIKLEWLGRSRYFGIANLEEGPCFVVVDSQKLEYRVIGTLPPEFDPLKDRYFGFEIGLAGENGIDGVYLIDGFALSYLPKGGEWRRVIEKVHVVKTFGGRRPWLPVAYVGEGCFAVSKTTKDRISIPKEWPEDESMFGAAEGITMLIEGRTGKVLKESKSFSYNHNPPLKIPDEWWRGGVTQKVDPILEMYGKESPTLFKTDDERRTLIFAGGKVEKWAGDERVSISEDGRHAVIYHQFSRDTDEKAKIIFRIVDGQSGSVTRMELESDYHKMLIEPRWLERRTLQKSE